MSQPNLPNADFDQSFSKASLREKKLRQSATFALVVPAVVGALWLIYSVSQVTTWVSRSHEIRQREAAVEQREKDAKRHVAEADQHRAEAEALAHTSQQKAAAAQQHADDVEQRLVKVRSEIGALGTLIPDFNSARAKAAKLMASEALETQLMEMRAAVGRTLGRMEQQIDTALPEAEQKTRVYIFLADESERDKAAALKTKLESARFDVPAVTKNTSRRIDGVEVRFFREQDKADAAQLAGLVDEQLALSGDKPIYTSDSDFAAGGKKFQVWIGRTAAQTH